MNITVPLSLLSNSQTDEHKLEFPVSLEEAS